MLSRQRLRSRRNDDNSASRSSGSRSSTSDSESFPVRSTTVRSCAIALGHPSQISRWASTRARRSSGNAPSTREPSHARVLTTTRVMSSTREAPAGSDRRRRSLGAAPNHRESDQRRTNAWRSGRARRPGPSPGASTHDRHASEPALPTQTRRATYPCWAFAQQLAPLLTSCSAGLRPRLIDRVRTLGGFVDAGLRFR